MLATELQKWRTPNHMMSLLMVILLLLITEITDSSMHSARYLGSTLQAIDETVNQIDFSISLSAVI